MKNLRIARKLVDEVNKESGFTTHDMYVIKRKSDIRNGDDHIRIIRMDATNTKELATSEKFHVVNEDEYLMECFIEETIDIDTDL